MAARGYRSLAFWRDLYTTYFHTYSPQAWRSNIGFSLSSVALMWALLYNRVGERHEPIHFLMALHFARIYDPDIVLASRFRVHPHTYRVHVWEVFSSIRETFHFIHWDNRRHHPHHPGGAHLCVDTTFTRLDMSIASAFQEHYYSGEKKDHGTSFCCNLPT